ncbi:transglycosylase SLT domain-containing protein, partial [Rhizobium johnstonii]|uniref:transglycosylase SLT domain-containing protein n=1 Tax=Rhizobium johnstonii TaxID=3019933 RepID=UPI003F951DB5
MAKIDTRLTVIISRGDKHRIAILVDENTEESSAGAVGLMQVMTRIGAAFGANDLTDPEQNIRDGTR